MSLIYFVNANGIQVTPLLIGYPIFDLQTVKGAKVFNAAVAAVSHGTTGEKEGEEKLKVHTHSYCCLDYAQVGHFL